MASWWVPDWGQMFSFDIPLLEIVLRGTLVYLSLFLLRVVLKRQSGDVSLTDVLLIVLIADAAQNAMAAEYRSVPAGLLLVATLVFWDYALDWLSYRIYFVRRLVHPDPVLIVQDGRLLQENLRSELLTREQLMSQLREQGVDDPRQVREAYVEGDGKVSVIPKEEHEDSGQQERNGAPNAGGGQEAEPPGDREGSELDQFLDAARQLGERVEWHRQQIAGHEAEIAAIRDALAQHGFRVRALTGKGRSAD